MIETRKLKVQPALSRPDDFYNALVDMHRELNEEQSRLANAKLILLLANHIGDEETLEEALKIAVDGLNGPKESHTTVHTTGATRGNQTDPSRRISL